MAAKKSATDEKPMTKTAFVRALPKDLPASEVVEKAKAAGMEISEAYVHEIRSAAKRAKKGAAKISKKAAKSSPKKVAKKSASKKTPAKRGPTKGATMSKRQFIESFPATASVADVVAEAAKAGLSISANYVYLLRAEAKKQGGKPVKAPKATAKGKSAPQANASTTAAGSSSWAPRGPAEERFVDFVAEIGFGRAEDLLRHVKEKWKSITHS